MYDNSVMTESAAEAPEAEYADAEEAKLTDSEEKENSYLDSCYDFDTEVQNGEEYSEWEEKGYSSVMKEPLSTFSADVDTASY
ncbi:MAG: von Willebrand factor type A domain-containing protein, partial [Lachnospiraceae bacterium]|nr:von Willebrand factor type A domain-containing protein [Lachnospiraceae bacterium]